MQCDVCKSAVPEGTRFCPKCGLEILSQSERTSRPPPMETDVFDWDEQPGKPRDYDFSKKPRPDLAKEKIAEVLQLAQARLSSGQVLEASALLKQIRQPASRHVMFRGTFEQIDKIIEGRKQAIREQCDTLSESGDSERLVALLAGQAANEMEPEEICSVALAAASTLYKARRAEEASAVLRLAPFRTLREESLVQEHRELELRVHRMRTRQHWFRSFLLLGGVLVGGAVGLTLFALFLWRGKLGASCWIVGPGFLVAAGLLLYLPQIRKQLEKLLGRSAEGEGAADKLREFLKGKRR